MGTLKRDKKKERGKGDTNKSGFNPKRASSYPVVSFGDLSIDLKICMVVGLEVTG